MSPDQLYQRRQQNFRHELRLVIAGVVGLVASAIALLCAQLAAAVGLLLLGVVAFGVAKVFAVLDGLSDQLEEVERRVQETARREGEGPSRGKAERPVTERSDGPIG